MSTEPTSWPSLTLDEGCEEFRGRFEQAVPQLPRGEIAAHSQSWPDMVAWVDSIAPHGLLCYFRVEIDPVMAVAGHAIRGTQYLVGNHILAERMFRHDPARRCRGPRIIEPSNRPTVPAIPTTTRRGTRISRNLPAVACDTCWALAWPSLGRRSTGCQHPEPGGAVGEPHDRAE